MASLATKSGSVANVAAWTSLPQKTLEFRVLRDGLGRSQHKGDARTRCRTHVILAAEGVADEKRFVFRPRSNGTAHPRSAADAHLFAAARDDAPPDSA